MNTNTISWDELFMRHAYLIASKSKDPSTKIGAVLVYDKSVISEGYNGFPRGVNDDPARYLDKAVKYAIVVHGEVNSVLNAARKGISTKDSIMYTQGTPCKDCAKEVINAGIKEIVVHTNWGAMTNWVESQAYGTMMLQEAGVIVRPFTQVLGIKTLISGKEIDV